MYLLDFQLATLFLVGGFSLAVITYSLIYGKKSLLIYSFIFYQSNILILSLWEILYIFGYNQNDIYVYVTKYAPRSFMCSAFLIFCFVYSSNNGRLKKIYMAGILAEPVIIYILYITNDYHNLVYYIDSYGRMRNKLLYHIHNYISTLYLISGTIVLFRYYIRLLGFKAKQTSLLILGSVMLMLTNCIVIVLDLVTHDVPKIILWLVAFINILLSSVFFCIVTFKFRFLNMVTAFRKIVESMKDSIFFVDSFNRIIYYNNSFIKNFLWKNQIHKDDNVTVFVEILKKHLVNYDESEKVINAIDGGICCNINGELILNRQGVRYYAVSVEPVFNGTKHPVGRLVSFSEITEYKKLMKELSIKNEEISNMNEELTAINEELITTNKQLKEHALTVEELAIARERNRYARDAHDTIGHTMTKLITILEVCHMVCKRDPVGIEKRLEGAINISRTGLDEIRRSIAGLIPEKLEVNSLRNALKCLVSDFLSTGINIDLSIGGAEKNIHPNFSNAIFRICQEALTNSLRHGKAKNATIILQFLEYKAKLYIFDDGMGCKILKKGMGLDGMEQRVKSLNGSINYGSDGEKGFNIVIELPLGGINEND